MSDEEYDEVSEAEQHQDIEEDSDDENLGDKLFGKKVQQIDMEELKGLKQDLEEILTTTDF